MSISYTQAAEYVNSKIDIVPEIAVVLGTGMAELADSLDNKTIIPYGDIPGFPLIGKNHHRCRMVIGELDGTPVVFMQGRLHYYEGYTMEETAFIIRMLKAMDIETVILTNASGAVNPDYAPGDIVVIRDHIKLCAESPLRGENPEELGERFFDMTNAYDKGLIELCEKSADQLGMSLPKGVYAYMAGPQFETPAEINMLKILGADLVGMSTVPEVIAAAHCGVRILALSGVSNMAAGIEGGGFNREAIDSAEPVIREKLMRLLKVIIHKL